MMAAIYDLFLIKLTLISMTATTKQRLSLTLLLVMFLTQLGHLSSASFAVFESNHSVANQHEHDHGHSHDLRDNAQSFHQFAGIYHEHLSQMPDHVHDTPQGAVILSPVIEPLPSSSIDLYHFSPLTSPLYRIERPPRFNA